MPMLLNHRRKFSFKPKWLTEYESRSIEEKKKSPFMQYLAYFWGPLPWVIEGAIILTGLLRFWQYFSFLLFLLFANALITFWLVFRKERRLRNSAGRR